MPLLCNFLIGFALFFVFQYYFHHVLRYRPIPSATHEFFEWLIAFCWGAFILYLGLPILKGKAAIITNPTKYVRDQVSTFFLGWLPFFVMAGLVILIAFAIAFSGLTLRLVHHSDEMGSRLSPIVLAGGNRHHFLDHSISLFDLDTDTSSAPILVIGRHDLYRVELSASDPRFLRLFPRREDLSFFHPHDLTIVFFTSDNERIGEFTLDYDGSRGLAEECLTYLAQAEGGGEMCTSLVRRVMHRLPATPRGGWRADAERDTVIYDNRTFSYEYKIGVSNTLHITVPTARSSIANNPPRAFEEFLNSTVATREEDVREFQNDITAASTRERKGWFHDLFGAPSLLGSLRGTSAERKDALVFARDVLSLGTEDVDRTLVDEFADSIIANNLTRNVDDLRDNVDDAVFVVAMEAVLSLCGNPECQYNRMTQIYTFVDRLDMHHNNAKPEVARIVSDVLTNEANGDIVEKILEVLVELYENAERIERIERKIETVINNKKGQLDNECLEEQLGRVYCRARGGCLAGLEKTCTARSSRES